ncbi:MAG: hypothetical protein IH991_22885, partial [Planctomycetes bacterium]|nr:hypothetical protein [Planctomycetota bacterium]
GLDDTKIKQAVELIASNGTGSFDRGKEVDAFTAEPDADGNAIIFKFETVEADVYRLTIDGSKISDAYGNKLEGQPGKQGTNYVTQLGDFGALTGVAGADEPTIRPGIPGRTGPYVRYPEFTQPRDVPNGFNPHDKVESRVVRLYYYRDAHRVAQIINRRVKSYNRQGVDMARQLADKARNEAEQITKQRQSAQRAAIEKSRKTREIENQGQTAENSLNRTLQELTNARRQGAAADDPIVQQLDASARAFSAQIDKLRVQVQEARDQEVQANEMAQQLEADEQRARTEQFRRERAAAHADPDTYAAGRPKSYDPVEQVSISVIGEGLIHLRGPLKGINTIRTMIDQIDQPVGQTRITIHTVQINGEKADRMEPVANMIQVYIDHARFLTMQSSEMLRRAVVQVAARKAEEARLLYPGNTQESRDHRYLYAFFGGDFIDELRAMDSEFLRTGNKILSLHSMDTTSLSSALNLLALAKNSTRREIFSEFQQMVQNELPASEQRYFQAGMTAYKQRKSDFRCAPKFYPLAENARFESLYGFFNAEIAHDDTLTPLQREFIRLAQIFKSRLITELEYKQRVMERGIIEERLGNRLKELRDAKIKEERAERALEKVRNEIAEQRTEILAAYLPALAIFREAVAALDEVNRLAEFASVDVTFDDNVLKIKSIKLGRRSTSDAELVPYESKEDGKKLWILEFADAADKRIWRDTMQKLERNVREARRALESIAVPRGPLTEKLEKIDGLLDELLNLKSGADGDVAELLPTKFRGPLGDARDLLEEIMRGMDLTGRTQSVDEA